MIELLSGIHETVAYGDIPGVKMYRNIKSENYPVHWHTAMEFVMPIKNDYTIVVDGIATTFHEGDIFILPPGTLHELYAPEEGERIILQFDYSMICNIKGMNSILHMVHPFALITQTDAPQLAGRLKASIDEICKEYDAHSPFMEARIYALMIQFFVDLGRTRLNSNIIFPDAAHSRQHEYVEKFLAVCNYITNHCTENITTEDLARLAGFSKFHFARLFKQFTNISCYEYLTQKRIAYAEQLLIEPDISITQVAMQSGFNSLSTFNRVFKTQKGCTPSEYKNLNYTLQKERRHDQS